MKSTPATYFSDVERCVDAILDKVGKRIVFGMPLGLGKPNHLANALYERANGINRHPWLTDLVIWRGRRSPRVLRRMSGVLDETSNPGQLLSAKGFYRLFTE